MHMSSPSACYTTQPSCLSCFGCLIIFCVKYRLLHFLNAIPVAARFKAWACGRPLTAIVGSNPAGTRMSGSCECCVLSRRGFASGWCQVQRSPTECGVSECDREETIKRRRPWATRSCCDVGQKMTLPSYKALLLCVLWKQDINW